MRGCEAGESYERTTGRRSHSFGWGASLLIPGRLAKAYRDTPRVRLLRAYTLEHFRSAPVARSVAICRVGESERPAVRHFRDALRQRARSSKAFHGRAGAHAANPHDQMRLGKPRGKPKKSPAKRKAARHSIGRNLTVNGRRVARGPSISEISSSCRRPERHIGGDDELGI